MRRLAYLLPFALVFVLACEKQQTTTTQHQQPQTSSFNVSLTTDPTPPVEEQDTVFKLTLTDGSGKPVHGAKITAALKMQTMDMGKNEVIFAEKNAGNYEGKGTFTMAGPWEVEVSTLVGADTTVHKVPIVAHKRQ